MKVLHLPTDVGGNVFNLSAAERKLGVKSDVALYTDHYFRYDNDAINLHLNEKNVLQKVFTLFKFIKNHLNYDIYHFNFGQSFFNHMGAFDLLDLPILKRLGKGIVVTFQGCEARESYFCNVMDKKTCWYDGKCEEQDSKRYKVLYKWDKYADKQFFLNPDHYWSVPHGEFLPYTPVDFAKWYPVPYYGEEFVFVHAPTQRTCKGTNTIISVFNRLKEKYPFIKLNLVEKTSREEAKKIYEQSHVGIDQLNIGWYGGFAVEMMALGKPVICYISDGDTYGAVPELMLEELSKVMYRIDKYNFNTGLGLYAAMEDCVLKRAEIANPSYECWRYAIRFHNPLHVAKKTKEIYEEIMEFLA